MTFNIDNPEGVATTPFGKYVWEEPSGEQGLNAGKSMKSWGNYKKLGKIVKS